MQNKRGWKACFPYCKFEYRSPLSADEALHRLAENIKYREKKLFRFRDGSFQGEVTNSDFHMIRDISYRNSFLPIVMGSVQPSEQGSIIKGSMKIHPLTAIFWSIWLGCVSLIIIPSFFTLLACHGSECGHALVPFGMFAFGVGVPLIAFWPEAGKARKFLCRVLDAQ